MAPVKFYMPVINGRKTMDDGYYQIQLKSMCGRLSRFSLFLCRVSVVCCLTVLLTGCDTTTNQPTRPREPSMDDVCVNNAMAKIARTSQPYPQWGPGREYVDVLIGGQWLRVPKGYLLLINSGYPKNRPGLSLILETMVPEFMPTIPATVAYPRTKDNVPNNLTIFLSCGRARKPGRYEYSILRTKEEVMALTSRSFLKYKKLRTLRDLGLEEWGKFEAERMDAPSIYFPLDPSVTHPAGSVVGISCFTRDPGPDRPEHRISCRVRNAGLPELGIGVEYDFPLQQLQHWRKTKEFVEQLVNTMIQDGDRYHVN